MNNAKGSRSGYCAAYLIRCAVVLLASAAFGGCSSYPGPMLPLTVYRHTVEPMTQTFDSTPVGSKSCAIREFRVKYSNVEVQWSRALLNDAAREAGLNKLYYADLETLVIMSVYRQKTIILYGE